MIHKGTKDSKPLVAIPSMIDVDMLYMQSCFVRQLDTYPRIGLSVFWPHVFEKVQRLRWGILAYIELYQSDPDLSTWGHRISIGALKNGALASVTQQPNYSLMATKEITYHWLCAPSWQVNFGVGLLTHWWGNIAQGEGDTSQLKLAPLTTIGLRYIIHPDTFFRLASRRIYYKKQKNSRVDCSITASSRKLASTQKYHFIVRGASLLSLPINPHNALLCSLELGYSQYKKALLASFFPAGGTEVTALLGYEIGYGRYLLQLQLGYQLTDATKTTIQTLQEDSLSDIINRKGSISVNLQYMVTKHFFVAISARSQEIPGIRVGISL